MADAGGLVRVHCVVRDGSARAFTLQAGATLMPTLRDAGVGIDGACEGSLACATCHVVVDPAWSGRLPEASDDEEAMLDTVMALTPTSRLSCQIKVQPELDGLTIRIP